MMMNKSSFNPNNNIFAITLSELKVSPARYLLYPYLNLQRNLYKKYLQTPPFSLKDKYVARQINI